jgi:hypothetical protein
MSKDEAQAINTSENERSNSENAARTNSVNEQCAPSPVFRGIPTNFLASCAEARQGGLHSYYWVGYRFADQIESNIPYDLSFEEWDARIDDLHKMISMGDDRGVWNWLRGCFPRCMQLVPSKRKEQFIAGLYAYAAEEWVL